MIRLDASSVRRLNQLVQDTVVYLVGKGAELAIGASVDSQSQEEAFFLENASA